MVEKDIEHVNSNNMVEEDMEQDMMSHKSLSMKREQGHFGFKNTGQTLKRTGVKGLKTKLLGF